MLSTHFNSPINKLKDNLQHYITMGRTKPTDYSKLVIYKIRCIDESVLDFYIGSTTHFRSRKCSHKYSCETGEEKIYKTIRVNGGWSNWTMVEIEIYPCNSSAEARIREEYWRETLQATMNTIRAYLSEEAKKNWNAQYREEHADKIKTQRAQYREEHADEIKTKKAQYYQEHADEIKTQKAQYYQKHADEIKTQKAQYRKEHADEIKVKMAVKYECECGSICCIKHKTRHERSKKHQDFLIK